MAENTTHHPSVLYKCGCWGYEASSTCPIHHQPAWNRRPILCLDFDGVCHQYTSGWRGAHVVLDGPVPGLLEFLVDVLQHFEVHIFSSRSHQEGGVAAMRLWFRECVGEGIEEQLKFPLEKPPFAVALDDRVLLFEGEFPSVEKLKTFVPWNKRQKLPWWKRLFKR